MSCGSLPPVPGLIPISALRKSPSCSNNNDLRECTPCAVQKEVMGEQRPRRTGSQPSVDLIDIARRSRGYVDTPQAPSGKARAERHRKSDRRRERRGGRKRSVSKRREIVQPVNPRVNPIFVWIRQEDTHIVDVKCEDYDKRNRIVLTKTAQGWRAIPRTETLVPNLKAAAVAEDDDSSCSKQPQQETRKVRKSNRVKRKSTAVQVDEDDVLLVDGERMDETDEPTWNVPVNIESHLPSHTIKVQRKRSPSPEEIASAELDDSTENVNTSLDHSFIAQASTAECSANKVCDVTPLDNLLAVAELEFNQQIQTEAWRESANLQDVSIELLSKSDSVAAHSDQFDSDGEKDEDCDYNEEDENNLAMDDILTRLEQSLQSPDTLCTDLVETIAAESEVKLNPDTQVPDDNNTDTPELVCSTITDDKPTDLSTSKKIECLTITLPDDDLMPTDLTVPKKKARSPSPSRTVSPRPSSRSSETIQSPQPSGLPAVPHSPDVQQIQTGGTKTAYLESLLSSSSHKIPLNSEVTITRQNEPLDFGKCRKSASPTVTCSEEINTCTSSTSRDGEPEVKKPRLDDITLRTILDAATLQNRDECVKRNAKNDSSRLLELLTTEAAEPDALTQLKQLHADPNLNLPDPMLVPKDRLSQILLAPGKEIPKLLNQRPELRLPEALAFPHLLQDPDILVITVSQLEIIIKKQTTINLPPEKPAKQAPPPVTTTSVKKPSVDVKSGEREKPAAKQHREVKQAVTIKEATTTPRMQHELCNDPNLTNMMWLPYLHQLEVAAMAFGNSADFLKMISSFPPYSNQMPDIAQMFPLNRFSPSSFPMPPLPNNNNPFEFPIWHENTQGNYHQRQQHQYERLCNASNNNNKSSYRDYVEKTSKKYSQKQFPPPVYHHASSGGGGNSSQHHAALQHQFMNVPAPYQPPNSRTNLHIPQYNTILTQKNPMYSSNKAIEKSAPTTTSSCDLKIGSLYRDRYDAAVKNTNNQKYGCSNNQKSYNQKAKLDGNHKSGNNTTNDAAAAIKKNSEFVTQPMDLSGSTTTTTKAKTKTNFCDSIAKSLKFDDIPEVGSTTASIEDMTSHMQESQKHLWHPLFGNQKSSSNPWNWTTVSATGE